MTTMLIELTNQKAAKLLHELQELNLIKVLKEENTQSQSKLSDKYRNVFSKSDASSFDKHTRLMRDEWDNI